MIDTTINKFVNNKFQRQEEKLNTTNNKTVRFGQITLKGDYRSHEESQSKSTFA